MRFGPADMDFEIPEDQICLQEALAKVKAACHVVARHVGPRTVTYEVKPAGDVLVSRVLSRIRDVGVRLSASTCTAREELGRLYIEITRDIPEIPRRLLMNESRDPYDLLIGVGTGDIPIHIRLDKAVHGIIAGTSGSGKSVLTRNLVRSIARIPLSQTIIFDPKGGADYVDAVGAPGRIMLIDRPAYVRCWVDLARREMEYRQGLSKDPSGIMLDRTSPLVLVFDEVQSIIEDQGVRDNMLRILAMGRSASVHCFLATQAPSAKLLGGNEMRINAPTRIVLKTATASDSRVALTEGGAEKLLGMGDAILLYQGRKQRIQVPQLEAAEMFDGFQD